MLLAEKSGAGGSEQAESVNQELLHAEKAGLEVIRQAGEKFECILLAQKIQ